MKNYAAEFPMINAHITSAANGKLFVEIFSDLFFCSSYKMGLLVSKRLIEAHIRLPEILSKYYSKGHFQMPYMPHATTLKDFHHS